MKNNQKQEKKYMPQIFTEFFFSYCLMVTNRNIIVVLQSCPLAKQKMVHFPGSKLKRLLFFRSTF